MLLGWNPESSDFWQGDSQQAALQGGILDDITSVMEGRCAPQRWLAASRRGFAYPCAP